MINQPSLSSSFTFTNRRMFELQMRLKEMRLKEQPNDLKKQRLQQSKSAGDKKRVFSVSLEEPLRDSADEDGAGGSCFQEEKMDEISSASVAGETVNDFATKGSSVSVFLGLSSNARYQIINILGRFNRIEMHSCGCGGV
ncbi:unnamed protein product [Brassica rapa]|uniref:Uncharacterized protein n=1 Tax=Brassica campestris TaxID=3711 RepID=A0A8D9M7I3_BRACM|nr:unnamed protein product [Brassica rapa]